MRARSTRARGSVAAVTLLLVLVALLTGVGTASAAPASASGRAAAHRVRLPPVNGWFDYQIGGAYRPAKAVRIVDRDRTERPAKGKYNVCYVNGLQTQEGDAAFWTERHPDLLVRDRAGRPVRDPEWPEYILDTSTAAKRSALLRIVGPWIDGCATAGYDGVEIDNLDSSTRSGKRLTLQDDVAFATALVARAHRDGLAAGQKNTPELAAIGKQKVGFDFAVAEECQRYRECGAYTSVYGDHVIEIEYTDYSRRTYAAACTARGARISVILRDRDVVTPAHRAYRAEHC